MRTNEMLKLCNLRLLEFDKNCHIDKQKALFFTKNIDMTLSQEKITLTKSGIDNVYSTGTI